MANALGINEMTESQAYRYITFNDALKFLTAIMTGARSRVTSAPTGVENACWIVASAFGAYSAGQLIFYLGGAFYALTPLEGMQMYVWDEDKVYDFNGTTWVKRGLTNMGATAYRTFYSDSSGVVTELAHGATGRFYKSNSATGNPSWATLNEMVTANNWKILYSNGSQVMTELSLGNQGEVLRSGGTAAAPEFAVCESRLASVTVNLQNGDAKTDIYTVPAGKSLIVTKVIIRSPSGSMAGGTDFDLGDGANADTWVNAVDLSGLGTSQYRVITGDNANYTIFDAADVFGIKPVTGATADVTATAGLFGYLF